MNAKLEEIIARVGEKHRGDIMTTYAIGRCDGVIQLCEDLNGKVSDTVQKIEASNLAVETELHGQRIGDQR